MRDRHERRIRNACGNIKSMREILNKITYHENGTQAHGNQNKHGYTFLYFGRSKRSDGKDKKDDVKYTINHSAYDGSGDGYDDFINGIGIKTKKQNV